MDNGYYWIRSAIDCTMSIGLHEDGCWYVPGVHDEVDVDPFMVVARVPDFDKGDYLPLAIEHWSTAALRAN